MLQLCFIWMEWRSFLCRREECGYLMLFCDFCASHGWCAFAEGSMCFTVDCSSTQCDCYSLYQILVVKQLCRYLSLCMCFVNVWLPRILFCRRLPTFSVKATFACGRTVSLQSPTFLDWFPKCCVWFPSKTNLFIHNNHFQNRYPS